MILGAAIAGLHVNAAIVPGVDTNKSGNVLLFQNDDTTTPKANPSGTNLKWTILNWSYYDEDTGKEYLEIHNELTMPIIETDVITFHVEFYKADTDTPAPPSSGLLRDGFECSLTKQLTTKYWDTTTKDLYVRGSNDVAEDFNNSVELDGQDWFVYQGDAFRNEGDHLCQSEENTAKDIQCDKIKCIIRRKSVTEDPDDFSFDVRSTGTTSYMHIPKGNSYILMNQNDSTTLTEAQKQRLNTL